MFNRSLQLTLVALIAFNSVLSGPKCFAEQTTKESIKIRISPTEDEMTIAFSETSQNKPISKGRIYSLFDSMLQISDDYPGLGLIRKTTQTNDSTLIVSCTDVRLATTCVFLVRKNPEVVFGIQNGLYFLKANLSNLGWLDFFKSNQPEGFQFIWNQNQNTFQTRFEFNVLTDHVHLNLKEFQ